MTDKKIRLKNYCFSIEAGFAYASMMEVDSQLDVSVDLGYITKEQYSVIEEKMDGIARQLSALRSKYKE